MNKYRKKPVVIEAFQITPKTRQDNSNWPNWLHKAWQKKCYEEGCFFCITDELTESGERLYIKTFEGLHEVTMNDWIIQGIQGKLYPCKPDIFEASYEREHNTNSSECWCNPEIEIQPNGLKVIIHNYKE